MIGKVVAFIAIISKVNTQLYPVTVSCPQGVVPSSGLPIYAKVRAAPNPMLSGLPSGLAAPVLPRAVLPNANIPIPNQQLVCPLEYALMGPQSISLPCGPLIPEPCYSELPMPSSYTAEFILSDYLNDYCSPEPIFDVPLGCLDPILTCYGTISEVAIPEIPCPISPFLPAASPVSPYAPPVSPMLPPVLPSQCSCHFLKKISIPPPFI